MSKAKFRQVVIVAKGFLKLLNLPILIQQGSLSRSRNLAFVSVCELLVMLTISKIKSFFFPPRVLFSADLVA